jgi:exodeoxyribonuclease III
MRIVSFNINGIRAREHQLRAIREGLDPDVLALQEIKVQDAEFPRAIAESLGYHVCYFGQKSHYGVALLSKLKPLSVRMGLPTDAEDAQRRVISGEFATPNGRQLTVINGYFPQGESRDHPVKFPHKRQFYANMGAYLQACLKPNQPLLLVGDMNIAPLDLDIGIGADNAQRWLRSGKCCFLPEERAWLAALQNLGLEDTFRRHHPDVADRFSWFDYRSRGFEQTPRRGLRIDLILANAVAIVRSQNAGIDYTVRALERPSDHCPVWVDVDC